MPTPRDYFAYTVVLANTSDKDGSGNSRLCAMSGVNWQVFSVSDSNAESVSTIYSDRSAGTITNNGSQETEDDGLIEFWATPGEYRIHITDPLSRIGNKSITWNSVPGWNGGIPGDFISNDNELDLATVAVDVKRQFVPIGAVLDWWRPDSSVAVPDGFVVCSGGTISSANHDFGTGQAINVPDLSNKFILGAKTASGTNTAGNASSNAPLVGDTGGSNATRDLTHTHTTYAHNHSLSADSGRTTVSFTNPTYTFGGTAADLNHQHTLFEPNNANSYDRQIMYRVKVSNAFGQTGFVYTTNIYDTSQGVSTNGWRVDTGSTDYTNYATANSGGGNYTPAGSVTLSTGGSASVSGKAGLADGTVVSGTAIVNGDANNATSAATANITGAHDFRPQYVGLLKIMKVKRA